MAFLVKIYLFLFATKVGEDEYGNSFFELKRKDYLGRKKRYCLYNGVVEASKISPEWHPFMHYQIDVDEVKKTFKQYKWQKPATPITTLSKDKYLPKNHILNAQKKSDKKNTTNSIQTKTWEPK